jgi:hypothetical protein
VLAAQLAGGASVPDALDGYDRTRRPRSQRVAHLARTDPGISLSTSALTYRVMTSLTRMTSSSLAERKTAWLWDWAPPPLAAQHAPAAGASDVAAPR